MSPQLDLSLLRAFVAVAEEKNFGRGAMRLATSQSAISVRIKRLEDVLGAKVMERDRQGTRLTPIGEQLLADARRLLAQSDQLVERVRIAASGQGERVRIASTQRAMSAVTTKLVSYLRDEYPKAEFSLNALSSPEQMEALRRGEIDIGVLQPPNRGFTPEDDISSISLDSEPLVVALSRNHPLAGKRHLKWSDLQEQKITLAPIQKSDQKFLSDLTRRCEEAGFATALDSQEISFRAIMPYLESGETVSLIPRSAACTGNIVTRAIENPLTIAFAMIWEKDVRKPLIPQIAAIIDKSDLFSTGK